ncbi:MAG: hypothetical protein M5T52_00055 [Ignavibacteriaceae bacterium]|nr:hypothetical protein [Ignavibacteriaceae bacterium]
MLALNSDKIDEEFRINLNIIATALTAQIKQRRTSASVDHLKADIDRARQLQKVFFLSTNTSSMFMISTE